MFLFVFSVSLYLHLEYNAIKVLEKSQITQQGSRKYLFNVSFALKKARQRANKVEVKRAYSPFLYTFAAENQYIRNIWTTITRKI